MTTIDEYSVASFPIEMFFNETNLSMGTAFIWEQGGTYYLVTNWHNVSGRDPNTGKHLSSSAAEPNRIRAWFNRKNALGNKIDKFISIRDQSNSPLWWVHPNHKNQIDVVALPLSTFADVEMYPINRMSNDDLALRIGMDVFVLGYPFGIGPGGFPVWKRGSIATEPQLSPGSQLHIFVDTASRPGMSGSPVIRRLGHSHDGEWRREYGRRNGNKICWRIFRENREPRPARRQLGAYVAFFFCVGDYFRRDS